MMLWFLEAETVVIVSTDLQIPSLIYTKKKYNYTIFGLDKKECLKFLTFLCKFV